MFECSVPKWIWVTLVILLSIIIVYAYGQLMAPNLEKYFDKNKNNLPQVSTEDLYKHANNGDIILLSGDTQGERTCRWCTGTMISHVGFLFREKHPKTQEDIVYILDCDIGQGMKDGVRVMALKDKLQRYKGMKVGVWKKLKTRVKPSIDEILDLISKYISTKFDNNMITWFLSGKPFLYRMAKRDNEMFCAELVSTLLQDLNIMKKDRVPASYHPGDFYDDNLDLEYWASYGKNNFFQF